MGLLVAVVAPAVIAQSAGDVSRTSDGHILHRRPPGQGANPTDPTPETPVFIYDPARAEGLPNELQRDGRSLARPDDSLEPEGDEPIHTAEGPKPNEAEPAEADTPPDPPPGPQSMDPSAPAPRFDPDASPADALGGAQPLDFEADAGARQAPPADDANSPPGVEPEADPAGPDEVGDATGESPPEEPPIEQRPVDPRTDMGDEAMPDRQTNREGRLDYREVFDPSIVPHKRGRSLDEVGPDFGVRLGPRRMKPREVVGNRLERGREVFWGSLLLEGKVGARIPIPSVAPDARVLSYEASPAQEVRFYVDQAGNHYAEPTRDGRLRLVFMTDAPAAYFGRSLPRNAEFSDVPMPLRPKVPKNVLEEARAVAEQLGFDTDLGYTPLLEKMVAYFRSFQPGEPPPASGNIYRDIALSRRGICRHRAHAFVVTAQALGYPSRFVFNEAHAFVEVYIPGPTAGWLRVDLGGGADELRVHNSETKTMHEPLVPDPFERPEGFDDMAGAERVTGLPENGAEAGTGPSTESNPFPTVIPRATEIAGAQRSRTTLQIDEQLVTRGDGLEVRGEVTSSGGARIDGGLVQVLLVMPDGGQAVALLGTAPVLAGQYRAQVRIPAEQKTGDYELVVEFLGHGAYGPSVGR